VICKGETYSPKAVVSREFVEGLSDHLERSSAPVNGVELECFKVTRKEFFGTDDVSVILFEGDLIFLKSELDEASKK
jgi:hypothetical protein